MKGNVLPKIISWLIIGFIFLIPLFFLPFTADLYEFNKNILLLIITGILLILWLLKMAISGKFIFQKTWLDLPVLVFAGTFIISTVINSTNKWETLWLPGSTGTIFFLTLFYFLLTNNIKEELISKCLRALGISASLLALLAIYQFVGLKIGESSLFPAFIKSLTLAGSLISLATFLLTILILSGTRIYFDFKNSKRSPWFSYITTFFILTGLVISCYQLFSTAKPLLLPFGTAWAIAVDSFKNWRLFLFGVGPSSFLNAFSQSRPIVYNLSNLWSIRFIYSSDYYLHLLTTVGILGFGAFIWIIINTFKIQLKLQGKAREQSLFLFIPLLAVFVILALIFHNFLVLFSLYLLLALFSTSLSSQAKYVESSKVAAWAIFIPVTLVTLAGFYFISQVYGADVYFKKSLNALAKNDGTSTYNLQIKAINLNPFNDTYRLAYSQTNLSIAYSLTNKSNLSDQDRQNITTLVQQAIKESKAAVNLNQTKIVNWENLAGIYRQLINFAQGADQWTITALSQAIKLDPNNPNLKLTLGGIYYALKNYDEAIRLFQQTVEIKPNFANGYYNLAAAYREKGDFKKAHEAMQITLSFVPQTSEDYTKAKIELDELAKKVSQKEATQSAQPQTQPQNTEQPLIEPEPFPSPVITPPIELPENPTSPEGTRSGQTIPGKIPQQEINPAPSATN